MANERIAVLYCGSAKTKNLLDKLLYLGVTPILVPGNMPLAQLRILEPQGMIITGSPSCVMDPNAETVDTAIYDSGIPILGICYGIQRMAEDLGGVVRRMALPEHDVEVMGFTEEQSVLFEDFCDDGAPVWMVHSCKVTEEPDGFLVTGYTEETQIAAMEDADRRLYGVQFHPEHKGSDPSNQAGTTILMRFLRDVCGCQI